MKYRVRGEGPMAGPSADPMPRPMMDALSMWWLLELKLAQARQAGDEDRITLFEAGSWGALHLSLRGREN